MPTIRRTFCMAHLHRTRGCFLKAASASAGVPLPLTLSSPADVLLLFHTLRNRLTADSLPVEGRPLAMLDVLDGRRKNECSFLTLRPRGRAAGSLLPSAVLLRSSSPASFLSAAIGAAGGVLSCSSALSIPLLRLLSCVVVRSSTAPAGGGGKRSLPVPPSPTLPSPSAVALSRLDVASRSSSSMLSRLLWLVSLRSRDLGAVAGGGSSASPSDWPLTE
mmetsp:Transcript_21976/g.62611  ORF Transcript_21976/g.62611 Transcript_21976/m.62611 type:complete len:219 (-) Transcript_21976:1886-2542(-)